MREAGDRAAGASNGPEVISKLRRNLGLSKDEDLICECVAQTDRDGLQCWPGRYVLTESGRRKVLAASAESDADFKARKRAVRALKKAQRAAPAAGAAVDHGPLDALAQGTDWRAKLERLEQEILAAGGSDAIDALPVAHYFARGVAVRKMLIPAGAILTGRIHKFSQVNVLLDGELSVLTEKGIVRMKAPVVFESPAGTKRVAYAHTNAMWLTIMGTHITDHDELVEELTVRTYQQYEEHCQRLLAHQES